MNVHLYAWIITVVVMTAILAFDIFIIGRRPHEPSMKEAGTAIAIFVGLAVVFGLAIWAIAGPRYAGEFFAGWLTEYSLSVDNLFIFLIIMTSLQVPRKLQQFALLVGIILALIFRGIFIAVGAAAINRYSWVFFIFGAFLLYTAVKLVIDYRKHEEEHAPDNAALRFVRKRFPVHGRLPRHQADHRGERQAADHPDAGGDHRPGQHRPAVRAGFHPGDLRPDPGAVPGVHRQRVRADGPAAALLPARRTAAQAGLPLDRPVGDPGVHRDQAGVPRHARVPPGREARHPVQPRDPDLAVPVA